MRLCLGDVVEVGNESRARLYFEGSQETIVIDQNTDFQIVEHTDVRLLIRILRGAISFLTPGDPRTVDVLTDFVNASVEGTKFVVEVFPDQVPGETLPGARVAVFEGQVRAWIPPQPREAGADVTTNQIAQALQGEPLQVFQLNIRPPEAVSWALHYQSVLPAVSLDQLAQVPVADRDAQFFTSRASAFLAAGRLGRPAQRLGQPTQESPVTDALADIQRALGWAPDDDDSDAYALQAVIYVALNDPVRALNSGSLAVIENKGSIPARIAYSYALQASECFASGSRTFGGPDNLECGERHKDLIRRAGGKLEAARNQLTDVLDLEDTGDDPAEAMGFARLAELWLSLGYVRDARDAAATALTLAQGPSMTRSHDDPRDGAVSRRSPELARALTVFGFSELTETNLSAATDCFNPQTSVVSPCEWEATG